jgi:hypothetical protein
MKKVIDCFGIISCNIVSHIGFPSQRVIRMQFTSAHISDTVTLAMTYTVIYNTKIEVKS